MRKLFLTGLLCLGLNISAFAQVDPYSAMIGSANPYTIERTNIGTSSVNLAFGFASKKLTLIAASSNTADLCINFESGTAECPAANTAGQYRLKPGMSLMLDDFRGTSISVIAASGSQSIQVAAWR